MRAIFGISGVLLFIIGYAVLKGSDKTLDGGREKSTKKFLMKLFIGAILMFFGGGLISFVLRG